MLVIIQFLWIEKNWHNIISSIKKKMSDDWHEYIFMKNAKPLWTSECCIGELNVRKTMCSLDFYLCDRIPWPKVTGIKESISGYSSTSRYIIKGSQGRNWRKSSGEVLLTDLLSMTINLLSYITKDTSLQLAKPHSGLGPSM